MPNMDRRQQEEAHHRRPQVFVRVEFGLSWNSKQDPKPHGIHYRSRVQRDRAPNFPRHVAPPTTNYLSAAAIYQFQQQQSFLKSQRQQAHSNRRPQQQLAPIDTRTYQQAVARPDHQHYRPREPLRLLSGEVVTGRSSRSSGNSHGRGRSAPPPLSANNWDVVDQAQAGPPKPPVRVWKDLPQTPSRFRLGEEDMPWSSMAHEPAMDPDDFDSLQMSRNPSQLDIREEQAQATTYHGWARPEQINLSNRITELNPSSESQPSHQTHYLQRGDSHALISNNSSLSSTVPPEAPFQPQPPPPPQLFQHQQPQDIPPPRQDNTRTRHDLEALGSAMMTIDNGFEDQWWSQGYRAPISPALVTNPNAFGVGAAGSPSSAGMKQHPAQTHQRSFTALSPEQMGMGWTPALPPGSMDDGERLSGSTSGSGSGSGGVGAMANMVSPVSTRNSRVVSGPVHRVSRSMSTRSEELWFSGKAK